MKNSRRQQIDISMSKTSKTSSNKHAITKSLYSKTCLAPSANFRCSKTIKTVRSGKSGADGSHARNTESTTTCQTAQLKFNSNSNEFSLFLNLPRSQRQQKVSQFKAIMHTVRKYNVANGSSHHMSGNFHTPFWDGPSAQRNPPVLCIQL